MIRTPTAPVLSVVAPYLLASFCLFWFSYTLADPDLWGHMRFGHDMLRARSIIQTDIYSYRTSGNIWINHEWLSEVILAGVYESLGTARPDLVQGHTRAADRRTVLYAPRCRGLGPWPSVIFLFIVCLSLRPVMVMIRPQMFTYVLYIVQLLLLEKSREHVPRTLWAQPILFAGGG